MRSAFFNINVNAYVSGGLLDDGNGNLVCDLDGWMDGWLCVCVQTVQHIIG